jgi:hypothetical protein
LAHARRFARLPHEHLFGSGHPTDTRLSFLKLFSPT